MNFLAMVIVLITGDLHDIGTVYAHGEQLFLAGNGRDENKPFPSGEGDGSRFRACVSCTGMEIAISAPEAGSEKKEAIRTESRTENLERAVLYLSDTGIRLS
jgi:hypothetical protein